MAIYHLNARVVSARKGGSAVKSAAYQSGEELERRLTGETVRYGRAERVADSGIALPEGCAPELADRETLWNAVEAADPHGTQAMRLVVALPAELDRERAAELARSEAEHLASEGLACDWAVHAPGAGSDNWHAHYLLAMRPSTGPYDPADPGAVFSRSPKGHKEYLLRDGSGAELWATSSRVSEMSGSGFSKVFHYETGSGRRDLTQAEASSLGLSLSDRVNKYAKTRHVEADPLSWSGRHDWLASEREGWASRCNAALGAAGLEERVDHRSNAERGIDEVPTVHEGTHPSAGTLARNRAARATNARLATAREARRAARRELRAAVRSRQTARTRTYLERDRSAAEAFAHGFEDGVRGGLRAQASSFGRATAELEAGWARSRMLAALGQDEEGLAMRAHSLAHRDECTAVPAGGRDEGPGRQPTPDYMPRL